MRRRIAIVLVMMLSGLEVRSSMNGQTGGDLPSSVELAAIWERTHLPSPPPLLLRHADVTAAIGRATAAAPGLVNAEIIGQSVAGRSITHLWMGKGPLHVLLWSQMHGDEPTATAALFDVVHYLQANGSTPHVSRMLSSLTLHMVPMHRPVNIELSDIR